MKPRAWHRLLSQRIFKIEGGAHSRDKLAATRQRMPAEDIVNYRTAARRNGAASGSPIKMPCPGICTLFQYASIRVSPSK